MNGQRIGYVRVSSFDQRRPRPPETHRRVLRPPHFDAAAPSCGDGEPQRSSVAGGSDRSPVSSPRTGDAGRVAVLRRSKRERGRMTAAHMEDP